MEWYQIDKIETLDTPFLALYKDRIEKNIQMAINMVKDPTRLRPHVKTNKIAEVCRMMMDAGISKFKCATIAEAEMLGMIKAKDVLLAYQPVGPKASRLLALAERYPQTDFSCVVDDAQAAAHLSELVLAAGKRLSVYIDLNTGMNRTGILPANAPDLFDRLQSLEGIEVTGVHLYDGHLTMTDIRNRQQDSDKGFDEAMQAVAAMEQKGDTPLVIVAGGSPTFPTHAGRKAECSPGTFVFWDWGYKTKYPETPFEYAALVVARVISIVNKDTITLDLGYKAVASESPFPRVYFLNAPEAQALSQSEEHLVLKVADSGAYKTGDILYGTPLHICPSVALYDKAAVIEDHKIIASWKVIARDRSITI